MILLCVKRPRLQVGNDTAACLGIAQVVTGTTIKNVVARSATKMSRSTNQCRYPKTINDVVQVLPVRVFSVSTLILLALMG